MCSVYSLNITECTYFCSNLKAQIADTSTTATPTTADTTMMTSFTVDGGKESADSVNNNITGKCIMCNG